MTYAWSLLASIGCLSLIFLKILLTLLLANPKWVRAVKGNKDNKKDSKWIGELFRLELVLGSFIPPKDIRILRELTRYRSKLISARSSEKKSISKLIYSLQYCIRLCCFRYVWQICICNFGLYSYFKYI